MLAEKIQEKNKNITGMQRKEEQIFPGQRETRNTYWRILGLNEK